MSDGFERALMSVCAVVRASIVAALHARSVAQWRAFVVRLCAARCVPAALGTVLTFGLATFPCLADEPAHRPCYHDTIFMGGTGCGVSYIGAIDMNRDRTVVGILTPCFGFQTPAVWSENDGLRYLPTLPELGEHGRATAISDAGHIGGWIENSPVDWVDGQVRALPKLPGYDFSQQIYAVNTHGQFVGFCSGLGTQGTTGAMWWNGEVTDLDAIMSTPDWVYGYIPVDINDDGWIVGIAYLDSDPATRRAFVWDGSEFRIMPLPPGASEMVAERVMNDGRIIGRIFYETRDQGGGLRWRSCAFVAEGDELVRLCPPFPWIETRVVGAAESTHDLAVEFSGALLEPRSPSMIWSGGELLSMTEVGIDVCGVTTIRLMGPGGELVVSNGTVGCPDLGAEMYLRHPVIVADLDRDCRVGVLDLVQFLARWDERGGIADLDGDGRVGTLDLLILLGEFET